MCGYAYLGYTQTTYDPGLPGYSYYRCSTRYESERVINAVTEPCTNKVLRESERLNRGPVEGRECYGASICRSESLDPYRTGGHSLSVDAFTTWSRGPTRGSN